MKSKAEYFKNINEMFNIPMSKYINNNNSSNNMGKDDVKGFFKKRKGLWITLGILIVIELLYVSGNIIYVYHDQIYKDWVRENYSSDFIDLGLSSGTLWATENEGGKYARYIHKEAMIRFDANLPTKEQFEELKDECAWVWVGDGYKVIGPNGNSINFPTAGRREPNGNSINFGRRSSYEDVYDVRSHGYYWSSTPMSSDNAYHLYLESDEVSIRSTSRCCGQSVRLAKEDAEKVRIKARKAAEEEARKEAEEKARKEAEEKARKAKLASEGYVDLGLPSGTFWRNENEGSDYARYSNAEAVITFGKQLPTTEQIKELINECTWIWSGGGYKVIGPNENSIYIPAAGYDTSNASGNSVGYRGCYWSYNNFIDDDYYLNFYSDKVLMDYTSSYRRHSVRLVHN